MTTESTFRAIAIANIALCLPIGLYYRIRSQATGENGWPAGRRRLRHGRPPAVRGLAWAVFAAYLINPAWVSWSSLALPDWLRWAGAALGLLVVPPLLFWTFHSLGKNLTDTVVTRREHTLVTHGPYRWVRHPFYVVVFLWGLSLQPADGELAPRPPRPRGLDDAGHRTRVEEAKLVERFGDGYRAYAERTGKFFPLPSRRTGTVERPSG